MGKAAVKDVNSLSPFELKDLFIKAAKESSRKADTAMLNAGRGNPNWIATTPREAFILLTRFGLGEARRVRDEHKVGLAGMPAMKGIAKRLKAFLSTNNDDPGASLLRRTFDYGVKELGFDPDAFAHELADAIIGDNYPVPDRMLVHAEKIVHEFLMKEMCDGKPPKGRFDIFAVEGGTAAMCYIFNTLKANGILNKGDTIALGTPIFTPYIEFPHIEEFGFKVVNIEQNSRDKDGHHDWQYTDEELRKLEDPKIKAFFVVNPSNPPSYAIRQKAIDQIVKIVKTKRPDLLILTDDVYGTFVPGFRSLVTDLPYNTILVYSYSKHFGCTGWRLGTVAIHEKNIYDDMIARQPAATRNRLNKRYESLTTEPEKMKFIDRMVAESRCICLNHTAGLSLPQQMQMLLFSSFAILDKNDAYRQRCREICHKRLADLYKGLGIELKPDPNCAGYYRQLDLEVWARQVVGDDFMDYVNEHSGPLNLFFRLATDFHTVLLNGSGFGGPPWSVRVSLANLNDEDYVQIGKSLAQICREAEQKWRKSRGKPKVVTKTGSRRLTRA
ncbi:MAG: bifunctional aspartate transaminase/aspartate 4-decarboxylase [Phycisphaerales bacterium]|nr:bifunctional aspartate transaminase/aspartate 4-decarboxylase [Phycisphaerales bacterium]